MECFYLFAHSLMALVLAAFDPSEKEALKVMKFTVKVMRVSRCVRVRVMAT